MNNIEKKTYIIAEIGNTHEGSLGLAKQFIKSASACGVDAVKMQTHIFEAESLLSAPNPPYFKDETRKEYFERTSFSVDQWKELKRYSEEDLKIDFFSSPFSLEAVDLLEEVGMDTYKIASGEVNNIPLLEKVAKTEKKVLLSSGMSSWNEIDEAVETLQTNGCKNLVVLQCTSEYPCPPEQSGLNVLDEMKNRYENVEIGYSDHTMGVAVPIAAVIKGATVIEKHFTLSQKMYGSDAMNSTEPDEFKRLVDEIRQIETSLTNNIDKDEKVKNLTNMKITFEKSIVSADSINELDKIEFKHLAFKKPGDGIPAKEYKKLLGKRINKKVNKDYKFKWEDFK
ncbi:N-acetylneuraminate synthase family protein [Poseidonibacter lekithochrous]|uniref:N-acetylneuraminate synthase family protein n=1 Tax=Poseidonibacter lekithochrous TaxID=1904463 RepID=UPI000AD31E8C|nr:N-acetylneuraminate synthase family protein [Poseidonibacter lekithochrous]QKJ22267.1 legionaminic acid synthase [Poseidonibacter lekithochrous]